MFERRLRLFLLFIFLGAFLLAARATQVQVLQRDEWLARATNDAERPTFIPARRGNLIDFRGEVIATDVPSFQASVNFRVMPFEPEAGWLQDEATRRAQRLPEWAASGTDGRQRLVEAQLARLKEILRELDPKWLKDEATRRARKRDGWASASPDDRLLMITEEQQSVRHDLDEMWATLARLSGKTLGEIEALRFEILEEVYDKHVAYVNRQHGAAMRAFEEAPRAPWYARLVAGTPRPPEVSTFQKKLINDQLGFHTILGDLTQQQYNELALAQERFPQYRPDGSAWTSVLRLGPAVRRRYPFGDVAAHVIGHVGQVSAEDRARDPNREDELRRYSLNDRIGRQGLELLAEQELRGARGTKYADRRGERLRADEADPGADVRTTIDIKLQREIQEAFKTVNFQTPDPDPTDPRGMRKIIDVLAMNGAAVVIDVKTGQTRALVSVPSFDLNQFEELYPKLLEDELNRPMINRALLDAMEPGSTVKPIVGLAAVTQKLIGAHDTVECTGFPIINGRRLEKPRCWTESQFGHLKIGSHHQVPSAAPHPNGLLTLADAIERSCNVYFETQGHKLGIQGLSYWMRQFGYGRPSGIGLPEARGLVPDKARIDATQRGSAPLFSSIGQSWVLTTPIQVANEMATIARDGVWQRPTLLVDPPPATQPADPDAVPDRYDLHLDPTALREVQTGMMNVVNSRAGTGSQVRRDDVVVAAKTGSAQATPLVRNLPKINGRYQLDEDGHVRYEIIPYGSHDAPNRELPWYRMSGVDETTKRRKGTHSWVAGYAPATNPQVAFAVYVEYGGSGGIGAASVVNKLIESCIRHGYVTASGVVAPVVPANLARPEELPAGADE